MQDQEMSKAEQHQTIQIAANIPKYFVYTGLKGLGFGLFASTWVIYLQQERGLSLAQAALIDVTFFVAAALAELPTGIVADALGRKKSLIIGSILLSIGGLGWTFAPTLPLIILAYIAMGVGLTFLSGAEDALFYESVQMTGRGSEYTRLVGRVGATFPGALALGSVVSGLLASINLILPFLLSNLVLMLVIVVVLTFQEPKAITTEKSYRQKQTRKSYREVLGQTLDLIRNKPILRFGLIYLALVPLASFMLESVFLQPQAVALGVPIAGIGLLVMAAQLTGMVGSTMADRIKGRVGEGRILYMAPLIIIFSLVMLALLQTFPSLVFIGVMGFFTAVIRPILLSRIQQEATDDLRATLLSVQSLMFTVVAAISQPLSGFIADEAGLPWAYFGLALSLGIAILLLLWKSRHHFPQAVLPGRPHLKSVPAIELQHLESTSTL